jgi:hypothetical protein
MDSLEYSLSALEAKSLFYNKDIVVYVEGKEDTLFWDYLFDIGNVDAHIEDVGGNNEIEKYINNIIDNEADFYVACDRDHTDFLDEKKTHSRIIKTFGYSIENSMYSVNELEKVISKLCKQKLDISNELSIWSEEFSDSVYELIKLDIANHKYKKGISIFGDNCHPFLTSQNSHKICSVKTNEFINKVTSSFSNVEIKEVENLITQSKKDFWFMIKGHFITHAIMNLIKYYVKKNTGSSTSVTLDMLYTLTVDCRENWENKIDIKPIIYEINKIKKSA